MLRFIMLRELIMEITMVGHLDFIMIVSIERSMEILECRFGSTLIF